VRVIDRLGHDLDHGLFSKDDTGTGWVPIGPITQTLAEYSDKVTLKTNDSMDAVHTSSLSIIEKECSPHRVPQLPSDCVEVTIPGQFGA
jgi:hypothetical protein